jgi:hypothetical protein
MHDLRAALASAAEARRVELPVTLAVLILVGGVGAAILNNAHAVTWAGAMSALLLADAELYKRTERSGDAAQSDRRLLSLWNFAFSSIFATLPLALALGGGAGMAAATILLMTGVVRLFGAGLSGHPHIALLGAAPLAITLAAAPLLMAGLGNPDWDAAVVSMLGGAGLIAYIVRARLLPAQAAGSAVEEEADLHPPTSARQDEGVQHPTQPFWPYAEAEEIEPAPRRARRA